MPPPQRVLCYLGPFSLFLFPTLLSYRPHFTCPLMDRALSRTISPIVAAFQAAADGFEGLGERVPRYSFFPSSVRTFVIPLLPRGREPLGQSSPPPRRHQARSCLVPSANRTLHPSRVSLIEDPSDRRSFFPGVPPFSTPFPPVQRFLCSYCGSSLPRHVLVSCPNHSRIPTSLGTSFSGTHHVPLLGIHCSLSSGADPGPMFLESDPPTRWNTLLR